MSSQAIDPSRHLKRGGKRRSNP